MNKLNVDLVVIGGGPAGMAAAVAAYDADVKNVLILEREHSLGGILKQCIHNGFGLHRFGEELTGPEYAARYKAEVEKRNIPCMLDTTVVSLSPDRAVRAMNRELGVFEINAGAVVLCMGCRERPKGALNIAGTRPSGIYTAGTAQRFVNINGYMPGREVVILGSGDIGLIMARRMTLEGARVRAVLELMPYSGGLVRNIEQCLNDFGIPLKLSHTVVEVHGGERLTGVTIAAVDENRKPIKESYEYIPCDTLLLSCGLIPENELTKSAGIALDRVTGGAVVDELRQTDKNGIFACGNVLHVHDLVDYVSEEAEIAGRAAAEFIKNGRSSDTSVTLSTDGRVRYTVPQIIKSTADTKVYFRVSDIYRDKKIVIRLGGEVVYQKKKQKLAPGEMETVTLSADLIKKASGKTLTLSVEE